MNRPLFAWSIFGICLLAATSAVGWLTLSAWRADQARQQALLDNEIRNALWRMDSLAAPLVAIEVNRASLTASFTGTPMLTPRLINGYVVRDASGHWSIRRDPQSTASEPLAPGSPFLSEDWQKILATSEPASGVSTEPAPAGTMAITPPGDLILWPDAKPPGQIGPPAQAGQLASNETRGQEAQSRNQLVQQFQQIANQAQPPVLESSRASQSVNPLRPMWVGGQLVLARQAPVANRSDPTTIELCWLNWPEWEALLLAQGEGASIPLRLRPCHAEPVAPGKNPSEEWRMMSLPIRLEAASHPLSGSWPAPLVAVWGLLFIVALAIGWLMRETLALSERRAAFVSAVTHELRTPLTTFRLYTEMLIDGVASDPAQQQTYFQTLNREANRLTHLVENVLAYARLEHGRSTTRNETLTVGELIDRCRPRLEQRVAETSLTLTFQISGDAQTATLTTNAMAVEQILFNLIDNSCKYARDAADPRILCDVHLDGDRAWIRISDFGPGLSAAARQTLFQAFQKSSSQAAESAPGIGLGLALSRRLAHELKGSIDCSPNRPTGLCFNVHLPLDIKGS